MLGFGIEIGYKQDEYERFMKGEEDENGQRSGPQMTDFEAKLKMCQRATNLGALIAAIEVCEAEEQEKLLAEADRVEALRAQVAQETADKEASAARVRVDAASNVT